MFRFKIAFEATEQHPSDRLHEPGRLLVLAHENGRAIAIERGHAIDLCDVSSRAGKAIAAAVESLRSSRAPSKTGPRRIELAGVTTLRLAQDNRGDPYRDGISLRFDADKMSDGQHFFLEEREIAACVAALDFTRTA